ncbi:pyridoxamine 5'-phosphate oxidase family protein [Methanimicrococcus blatticola]|uniref:Putative pyridoxamine 5'-phosphate oxidase family protein n=1 Tax=Methanimicrococcus blatticola TaxID=91560 RepID=A0A484F649_9EURY|nr:pyridoxamine 5'-phosphate oxidase family protein [Methanimicrococcus blatticola]MBZ3935769.1 pyridoxamine 5'-phosphate oxidase family protein [Methanimicrococcus blatticola]MCC2508111.1 pyridoxamine 5'-phosphate oxidase family protein [Methanimicrococcus blatticola]TDQ68810.1 putative pyridoxamine 5'-phosphate oxidase family protein [Methanimicrococcus blatticola]
MQEVLKFLTDNPTFYIATNSPEGPRVRPFGFIMEDGGKLYLTTSNQKDVFKQLQADPRFEISATSADGGSWIRVRGKAVFDTRKEIAEKAFKTAEFFTPMYQSPDNPILEFFYIGEGEATFYSFVEAPKTIQF